MASIQGFSSNQMSQLDMIAQRANARRADDGNLSPEEIRATMKEVESFVRNNGGAALDDAQIAKAQAYVKSQMDPVDRKLSATIEAAFSLGRVGRDAAHQQDVQNRQQEGFWGGLLRSATEGNPRIAGAARFVGADVNNNGDSRAQVARNQAAADNARNQAVNRVMQINDSDFQARTRTHCVGDSLNQIGFRNKLPDTAKVNPQKLKEYTGKEWTGISIKPSGFTPAERALIAKNKGQILVQEGNHTMVGQFDEKTGKIFANGKEIKSGNIFIPEKAKGVNDTSKEAARQAHTYETFSRYQKDLDPHYATENSDERNMKKLGVLASDPSSRALMEQVQEAAKKGDFATAERLLKSKGIELSPNMLKNVMSTMSVTFNPPKDLIVNGKSIGKASNMFEAFALANKAGVRNNVAGGIEKTNPDNTMNKWMVDGDPKKKADIMFQQFQALCNGEDGC
ncbi:MAG: hypothetical protein U0457_17440 [Candidatus Sericytochromatia bacterium]